FARAVGSLPGVDLSVVSQDPAHKLPSDLRHRLVGFEQVADAMQAKELTRAVHALGQQHGGVDRLMGILEPLQEPLGAVREQLGIRGMDEATARNFRDKAQMKERFAAADVPCARHRLCADFAQAKQFAHAVGYPVVGKPPAGAGAKATSRCESDGDLEEFLASVRPGPGREVLIEEFVQGREFSFDSITVNGQHALHNICCYYPTPLEVMDHPWIQWCVVLPKELDHPAFEVIHRLGPRALDVLGMWTGMSHMEWFRRQDGSVAISEVAARPPGAQFVSLMGHVYDVDVYRLFAQLMVFESVDVPERRYAAGAAYLRGQLPGGREMSSKASYCVRAVHGLDEMRKRFGSLVVESKLPRAGQPKAETYEGDGFLIVRHPDTNVVRDAVQQIVQLVRVELEAR
ncbi:MAG: acetyl-CoA carboxylase biotin carboxylase subunit family protein, partial [Planctomycetota bacterium]